MPGCTAAGCSNRSEKGFLMKRFPKDPFRRKQWEEKAGKKSGTATDTTFLCEVHFELQMWERTREDGTRKLRHNAVPTLFNFVENKQKITNQKSPEGTEFQEKNEESNLITECNMEDPCEVPVRQNYDKYKKLISQYKESQKCLRKATLRIQKLDNILKKVRKKMKRQRWKENSIYINEMIRNARNI